MMSEGLKNALLGFVEATEGYKEEQVIKFLELAAKVATNYPKQITRLTDEKGVKLLGELQNIKGNSPLAYMSIATKIVDHVKS